MLTIHFPLDLLAELQARGEVTRQILDAVRLYLKRPSRPPPSAQSGFDREPDIDRHRHVVFVAGEPRRLNQTSWRLFTLLYRNRGRVVANALLHSRPSKVVSRLRSRLAGSRYEIVNHYGIGYELIVDPAPATVSSEH